MIDAAWLLPAGVGPATAGLLVLVSFASSAITAALGLGGGVLMLTLMAGLLPAPAVIPIHAVVQFASNSGRVLLMRAHVVRALVPAFALGTLIGAIIGGQIAVSLPVDMLRLLLGLFILYSLWIGRAPLLGNGKTALGITGAIGAFLTMFVGATGPFISAQLRTMGLPRMRLVATHASLMILQHSVKIVVFGLLGFAFGPWLPLLAALVLAGFAGTVIGKRLLESFAETRFQMLFRLVVTVLALNLVLGAAWDLLAA